MQAHRTNNHTTQLSLNGCAKMSDSTQIDYEECRWKIAAMADYARQQYTEFGW